MIPTLGKQSLINQTKLRGFARPLRHGKKARSSEGFSLLEVVLSLGMLMSIIMAVTTMLRSSFDMKAGLSENANALHRMSVSMAKLSADVHHAFIIDRKDSTRLALERTTQGIFKIEKEGDSDKLSLTTRTHRPLVSGAKEGDATYVIYQLRDSKTASGRKDLYRASSKVVPLDFKEEPAGRLLAKHVKSFKAEWWKGDGWSKDRFDSTRSDTRDKLPRLVKLTLEVYVQDREDGDGLTEEADEATDQINTVIFIPEGLAFAEVKQQDKSIKWSAF